MLKAATQGGKALQFIAELLRGDKAIALAAVGSNGYALKFSSVALKADCEEAQAAAAKHKGAICIQPQNPSPGMN